MRRGLVGVVIGRMTNLGRIDASLENDCVFLIQQLIWIREFPAIKGCGLVGVV